MSYINISLIIQTAALKELAIQIKQLVRIIMNVIAHLYVNVIRGRVRPKGKDRRFLSEILNTQFGIYPAAGK